MDYTSLVADVNTSGSIAQWLNHAALQSAASTILDEAQSAIYRSLRHWQMKVETTGVFVIGNDFLTLPTDFLDEKTLYITGTNMAKMTRKTDQTVKASYQYDGSGVRVNQMPTIYYNNATQLKFDSPADVAYPYEMLYYGQPAALGVSNLTNFLTTKYPRLVRCACMTAAAEFMKDAGAGNYDRTYWAQMTQTEIDKAQMESDRSQRAMEEGAVIL